jgi:hypothetical protein
MNGAAWSSGKRWFFISLIILFVVVVRVRLLDVPLERDEGEYAYMGQLLLQGIPPYSEAYNMKFPGTYLMYAGAMSLFGQTIRGIHLGLLLLNLATVLLLFHLGRKIVNDFAALIAAAAYALLSLSSSVFGFAAHATHFVALPAIGGALLLLFAAEKNKLPLYFLSGILFGLAFIMKQPGIFFSLFGATYIIYHDRLLKKRLFTRLAVFTSGALLPFLAVLLWFHTSGVFDKFWFWTFQYAAKYGTQVPLSGAFAVFLENFLDVADGFMLLWIASALGFVAAFINSDLKKTRGFIALFALFSFLSICPGFYFRPHYFVTLLPAISLLIGVFFHYVTTRGVAFVRLPLVRFVGLGVFIALLMAGVVSQKNYLFQEGPADVSRSAHGLNPFPESLEIAKFIEAKTGTDDKIAVLGSEPQIFFYSNRRSATGHIYMYGLMERHAYALSMQKEMIREVESSNPKFVVLAAVPTSWLVRHDSEQYIFGWLDTYLERNYRLVGVADIVSAEKTVYRWNNDAEKYTVQSPYHVLIFEQTTDSIPPN